MKYFFLSLALVAVLIVLVAGVRGRYFEKPPLEVFPDMDRQLKYKAQKPTTFFEDGRIARPPIEGTIPIGYEIPHEPLGIEPAAGAAVDTDDPYGEYSIGDGYYATGRIGDFFGDGIPVEVTPELVERGRERYEINCAVCHASSGMGNGTVTPYWQGAAVASLQSELIRNMPDGQIYYTIAFGKGVAPNWTMFPYADKISVDDRWAIVAYLRVLQQGMNASIDDVPPEMRDKLDTTEPSAEAAE